MSKNKLKDPDYIFVDEDSKKQILQRAYAAGASRSMSQQAPFRVSKVARNITVATSRGNHIISKKEQVRAWHQLWKDPFMAPYIFCVSSSPTDIRAQMVAMRLFLRATVKARKLNLGNPKWHNIYGGIEKDKLRDDSRKTDIPFLVLSNVVDDSTWYKMEKLRDILTQYNNIPRIVVTSDSDPVEFMTRIRMPVNFALYIGVSKEKRL